MYLKKTFAGILLPSLLLLTAAVVFPAAAQDKPEARRTYSGTVRDEDGTPLFGAAVLIGSTREGVTTDLDGRYSISAAPGALLRFSSLGYLEQQARAGDDPVINMVLPLDRQALDEVVVIGYGSASRKLVSSSIASVRMDEVDRGAAYDPIKALQGHATGVSITSASGTPGSRPNVIIRGVSSISGGSAPLYVVDGIPAEQYPTLNNEDIERIEVLKDASATAIYGSRGNAGVILITTKSGQRGATRIDASVKTGLSQVAHDVPMANTEEYIRTMTEAIDNYNLQKLEVRSLYIPPEPADFDWVGAISRKWAKTSSASVSLSGGSDKFTFYVSGGMDAQEGYIRNTAWHQYTGRAKFSYKVAPWLAFNLNSSLTWSRQDKAEETSTSLKVLRTAREEQPWYTPYREDGSYMIMTTTGLVRHNPVMLINEEKWWVNTGRLATTVSLDFTPLKGLKYTPSISGYGILDLSTKRLTENHNARALNAGWGAITEGKNHSFRYVFDNILSYEGSAGALRYSAMAGHSWESYAYEQFGFMSSNYANEAYPSSSLGLVTSGAEIFPDSVNYAAYALESWFARAMMNWDDRYILNLSIRSDGTTRFPKESRFGTFPAASLAWFASNEKWFPKNPVLTELKIRLSAGQTGSMAGIGNWAAMSLISAGSSYNGSSAFTVGTPASNLKWEKSTKYDAGADFGLWNDRLTLTADAFYSITNDMLYSKPVLAATGMNTVSANIGSADNLGAEFAVNARILDGPVKWTLGANVSWVRSRLLSLLDGSDAIIVTGSGSNLLGGNANHILQNGQPISSWYMYRFEGIYQRDEDVPAPLYAKGVRAGDCIYFDRDGNDDIDENDRILCGKATPDWFGGLSTNLSWKGLALDVFCTYSVGNNLLASWKGVNGKEGCEHLGIATTTVNVSGKGEVTQYFNVSKAVANGYWRGEGTSNTIPRPVLSGAHTGYDYDYNVLPSTRYLEDASYFRVKTVTLSYSLPQQLLKRIGVKGLKAYLTVDNALCFTKYDGFDPEASYESNPSHRHYGVDFGLSPTMRTFLLGAQFKF
jgi:TonB-linked SusC/RagA family outer membrane protein